jgi:hypothetical protein
MWVSRSSRSGVDIPVLLHGTGEIPVDHHSALEKAKNRALVPAFSRVWDKLGDWLSVLGHSDFSLGIMDFVHDLEAFGFETGGGNTHFKLLLF